METKTKIEGNEMISDYMGERKLSRPQPEIDNFYISRDDEKGRKISVLTRYDSSWDWLMPVVQKIGNEDKIKAHQLFSLSIFSDIEIVWFHVTQYLKEIK